MATQGLVIVLDPDGRCFGRTQRVDAQEVGQGAVMDGDRLSDLEEPDQLEPIQALVRDSSEWILGRRAYTAGSLGIIPSMWANGNNPRTACIEVLTEEAISPDSPR